MEFITELLKLVYPVSHVRFFLLFIFYSMVVLSLIRIYFIFDYKRSKVKGIESKEMDVYDEWSEY